MCLALRRSELDQVTHYLLKQMVEYPWPNTKLSDHVAFISIWQYEKG